MSDLAASHVWCGPLSWLSRLLQGAGRLLGTRGYARPKGGIMISRLLTGLAIVGVAFGAVACGASIDKNGTKDALVRSGQFTEAQAECTVDRIDAEFGGNKDVIKTLASSDPDALDRLSAADRAKVVEIVSSCLGLSPSRTPTTGVPSN
jgi:hypothetical protein